VVVVQAVGVIHRLQPEIVEVLALPGEVIGDLAARVLPVVAMVEERREEGVEWPAHRGLGAPVVEVPEERLGPAEIRCREDQEPSGPEDAEDLLERVEGIPVEVLE
jgi:hypothetical protein